jgi:NADPH:quinone reductase
MRALRQTSRNGPQDLHLVTDVPVPDPGPGEVLIKVTAAGVNFGDIQQSYGIFPGGPQPPYVAGFEAAGEIVAAGEGVAGPPPGTHVIGASIGGGAFAEYMLLPAVAAVPVPAGWTGEQALGLVVNWPTALAALRPLGRLAAGETVVVHAAAGGTGQAAVRMAKHYGATVIAVASTGRDEDPHRTGPHEAGGDSAGKHETGGDSTGKDETLRALGADHILDAGRPDLADEVRRLTGGAGADLVLETNGGAAFAAGLAAAKRVTGRVVVYGTAGGEAAITNTDLVYRHQIQLVGLNIGMLIRAAPQIFGAVMGELFGLIAAGVLPPGRPTVYDLADGPKALAEMESRATIGKLALLP